MNEHTRGEKIDLLRSLSGVADSSIGWTTLDHYRICRTCVMDTSAQEIEFDENGVCSFCHQAQKSLKEVRDERQHRPWIIHEIKKAGQGKKYDCLIGLSGGVDSSLTLHYAVEQGLRLLTYQVDNGWNKPEADENVMNMVEILKVPFYRYTIDLGKFVELQGEFIASGTPNVEIPTDHLLMATSYEMAARNDIKYIISGGNVATESIMPPSWGYSARDLKFIRSVYKNHTGKKLSGLPLCGILKYNWYLNWKGIKTIYLLDYYSYNREQAIRLLQKKYKYRPYGEKHEENYFTWWFQNKYLFEKFYYDKRKAHYSSLINSGQMSREDALQKLQSPPVYPDIKIEFMKHPKRTHKDYPNNEEWFDAISRIVKSFRT